MPTNAKSVRVLLFLLTAVGAFALALFALEAFWAENEFTQPESLIANQSQNLREFGYLYYSLGDYPYMVSSYMPLTYALGAIAQAAGLPAVQAGRAVSLLSLAWLLYLVWSILRLYVPEDRRIAWLGVALCACSATLATWASVGQADLLAVAFTAAAFREFSRHWLGAGDRLLLARAAAFVILGLFSKQTVLAVPAAIFTALWLRRKGTSLKFAFATGAAGFALLAATEVFFDGRFLANTVKANMNPLDGEKLRQQAGFWLATGGGLAVIAWLGGRQLWRGVHRPLLLWTLAATAVLFLTAGKVGSDLNYQVEATVALVLTACVALHSLGFFTVVFTKVKSPAPLLLMPLLFFVVVNLRLDLALITSRYAKEVEFREQVRQLKPMLPEAGRVLSADVNVMQRLGKRIEVDPFIYRLLVQTHVISAARVTEDLAQGLFAKVLLYHPATDRDDPTLDVPSLPREQRAIIAQRYKQVAHVPGPYAGGLYVYEPR